MRELQVVFGVRGVGLALLVVALIGASAGTAASRAPRFLLTVEGTQRFEWTLDGQLEGPTCIVKGHGVQVLRFATPRPVRVVATSNYATSGPGGYQFQPIGTGKRLVPLTGTETRDYQVESARAEGCSASTRGYGQSCQATNRFLAGAGVSLVWFGAAVEMHVPVNVLLYERRPKTCDLLLFDLRNSAISQLINYGMRTSLKGGTVKGRGKVLTSTGKVHLCVDPSDADAAGVPLDDCSKIGPPPARGAAVTGTISLDWKITLRRQP
jgi:hypothetical protein